MANIQYLSAEGLKKLQDELLDLKSVRRKELIERIEAAMALGDLSENAEYHEAKDALGLLENRIYEIQETLKNYQLIDEGAERKGKVAIGSTVKVKVKGVERTFNIVGSNEADPVHGKISTESPIGSALMGATAGTKVEIKSPGGLVVYEVLEIQ